jgi:hypothetical protein
VEEDYGAKRSEHEPITTEDRRSFCRRQKPDGLLVGKALEAMQAAGWRLAMTADQTLGGAPLPRGPQPERFSHRVPVLRVGG